MDGATPQRLVQIGEQIFDGFDADREPDEVGRHLQR